MNWITPFNLAPTDRGHTRAMHLALVRDLYQRGRGSALVVLAMLALLTVGIHYLPGDFPGLRLPIAALLVAALFRAGLAFRGGRLEVSLRRPNPRFLLFTAGAGAQGLALGWVFLTATGRVGSGPFMLITLVVFWFASLGCITMAGSPCTYAAFVLPSLGGLAVAGFLHPPFGMGYLFPTVVLAFLVTLVGTELQVHRSLFNTVLLNLRLEDLALRDPLTGLRNRRYLQEFMQEETPRVLRRWAGQDGFVVNRRSISLILVDLDHFKQVNDEYGHPAGDAVLLQVAQLLREIVRKPDLVLRWGGEEFLLLALDSDRVTPPLIAVRVHEQLARHPFVLPGGQTVRLTCSIGYAIFPFHPERPEGLNWEQVFRLADQCLYDAKEGGRNALRGILPGEADADDIVTALGQPEVDFNGAVESGKIRVG